MLGFLWLILAGLAGGALGGMGMGGGTILIPILTIFLSVSQHLAQAVNLLAFIPMGVIAIIIHAKNKLLDTKAFVLIIIPAIAIAVCSSVLAAKVEQDDLKFYFGIFLVLVGVGQLIAAIVCSVKARKQKACKGVAPVVEK